LEGQTTQWAKEKEQKDKYWSRKYYTEKERLSQKKRKIKKKGGGDVRCSGRVIILLLPLALSNQENNIFLRFALYSMTY
jgi:hypothetical protein